MYNCEWVLKIYLYLKICFCLYNWSTFMNLFLTKICYFCPNIQSDNFFFFLFNPPNNCIHQYHMLRSYKWHICNRISSSNPVSSPLRLSLISCCASLLISWLPPARKPPAVAAFRPPDFSSIVTLDNSAVAVRICLKITGSITLGG